MSDVNEEPLSEAEREQLSELQYRAQVEAWNQREADRLLKSEKLEPVAAVFGSVGDCEALVSALDTIEIDDEDAANRLGRIVRILRLDALELLRRFDSLSVAEPKPEFGHQSAPVA